MSTSKSFKTKTGYCHILPDRVLLTGTATLGDTSKMAVKNSIHRVLIVWAVIALIAVKMGYDYYLQGNQPVYTMFFVMAIYLAVSIVVSLNNSTTPVIMRDSIVSVKLNKGQSGLTRPRFIVTYKNEKGKELKRLIILKGTLKKNKEEIEEAEEMMREEGLLS